MSLFPDPGEMFAIADRIAAHARTVRARARILHRAVDSTGWQGPAATAFRVSADGVLLALASCADRLDDAADAMRRHACTVRKELDVLDHLRSVLIGVGIDVFDLVHAGVVTPVELLHGAGHVLDHVDGLLDDAGNLIDDAGHAIGGLLGVH